MLKTLCAFAVTTLGAASAIAGSFSDLPKQYDSVQYGESERYVTLVLDQKGTGWSGEHFEFADCPVGSYSLKLNRNGAAFDSVPAGTVLQVKDIVVRGETGGYPPGGYVEVHLFYSKFGQNKFTYTKTYSPQIGMDTGYYAFQTSFGSGFTVQNMKDFLFPHKVMCAEVAYVGSKNVDPSNQPTIDDIVIHGVLHDEPAP